VAADSFTTSHGDVWTMEIAGDGPPVLALHGVGGGSYFFRGLPERLGLRYRVTATELPSGLAPAATAEPASMAEWADGLVELVRARINQPAVIVGHSLGTILALELWRRAPDLVSGLVFVGGVPRVRDELRTRLAARIADIAVNGMAGWGPRVSPGVFGPRAFRTRLEVVGLFERLLEAHPASTYVRNVQALLDALAVDVVPTVTVPCLAISGTDDVYAPPEFVREFLSQLPRPCRHVVMEEIGHMPFFEAPDEFAAEVAAFLDEVSPA
jgi:pimeloyl-ACP methyl ester carboxylesterase